MGIRWARVWGVLATLLAFANGMASATTLGPAQDYNLFILGDATGVYSDSEGRVAIGGNASFTGYSIGISYPPAASPNALVVNGNLTFTDGTVYGGVHHGGTANLTRVDVEGSVTQDQPIDFAAARTELTALSSFLATQSTNGTINPTGARGLTLTGTSSTLNVFNLTAEQFASANGRGLDIVSPVGSTVLINVAGTSPSLANFQMYVNGSASETNPQINNILFNFSQATTLTDSNVSIYGSVLAPNADLNFGYNHINGTLVGKSLKGNIQANNYPFKGNLPPAVPEPSSIVLLGICGAGLALATRFRNPRQG